MEEQPKPKTKIPLLYEEVSSKILDSYDATLRLAQEFPGFSEETITTAFVIEITERGLPVEREVEVNYVYKGHVIGSGRVDLVINHEIPVEIKMGKKITQDDENQTTTYARALKKPVAWTLNFGAGKVSRKRFYDGRFAPPKPTEVKSAEE
jgi:GxxExxY protein